jgi:hypothetical protein
MGKSYRTSQGTEIDFDKLRMQNETVRAVGNMSVNARGDVIDSNNNTVATRSKQVNKNYSKQTSSANAPVPQATPDTEQESSVLVGLDQTGEK